MRIPYLTTQQLKSLFGSLPETLCILNYNGRFLQINSAFSKITGYSNHDLATKHLADFVHVEDQDHVHENLARLQSGELSCSFEHRFHFRNGAYHTFLWSCHANQKEELICCSVTELSQQSSAISSLYEVEDPTPGSSSTFLSPITGTVDEKFRYHKWMDNIIENYTDGFFTLNQDWTVINCSKLARRMVNPACKEIIGTNFWSLFPVGTDHQLYREAKRSLEINQTVHFEEFYPHLNKWLEITAYPYQDTVTLFFKDTTTRRKQEIDLNRLADDYKVLFANNPLPMWAYDLEDLKIMMVNNAALSLYGYTRKEFLSLNLYDLRPEEEHQRLKEELKNRDIYKDLKLSSEWQHQKKDGTIIFVDIASHLISLNERRARLIVANNITERLKAQNKLLTQNRQLREIAQLSSHDLRGPVASILGLVSLFDETNADQSLNQQIIKHLKVCAQDMDEVIHAIVKKTYEEGM